MGRPKIKEQNVAQGGLQSSLGNPKSRRAEEPKFGFSVVWTLGG